MAGSPFDKDFGYLIPFLDKIAAYAKELPDPVAREELVRLIAGEKMRWERIRALLSGATANPNIPSEPTESADKSREEISKASAGASSAPPNPAKQSPAFTVGSLRPRRDN